MPSTSQFTIYTSNDPQGPGPLTTTSGALVTILDACLVNGYGTGSYYKAPIGWLKPLPNLSSSLNTTASTVACYQQPSGSGFTFFVNDTGAGTGGVTEAWVTGWEYMTSLTASGGFVFTGSNSQGSGYGQFPLPSQLGTYGHVIWRKGSGVSTTPRFWLIAADAYTVYLWVLPGDTAGSYTHAGFGDFFSLRGSSDKWRCFIYGRVVDNSAGGPNNDFCGNIACGAGDNGASYYAGTNLSSAQPGHFLARTMNGTGGSTTFTKKGDPSQASSINSAPVTCYLAGVFSCPNSADNSFYIQPLQIIENAAIMIRGRLRGLYHPCHAVSYFNDGQTITAGGDYNGKTLTVIRLTPDSGGAWLLETSPTVETN